MIHALVVLLLAVTPADDAAYSRAFNAGYDARYKHHLPRSANPYPIPLIKDREWWDDGYTWKGWMPDWREFLPGGNESFVFAEPRKERWSIRTSYRSTPAVQGRFAGR